MFSNWRFNPFSGTMNSVPITDEEHTIEYHDDWCAYGIQLDEAPELENPSSVSIVEDVTGQPAFTEVPRTQAPSAGEFRVDYDALTYYGTGRIEFNAADVGKAVLVSYKGTGWTVKNRYPMGQTTIPTNLEVTEDTVLHGDLDLDGENTGGGDLHVAGDADIDGNVVIGGPTGTGDLSVGGDVDIDGALEVAGGITGDLTGNADTADGINETGTGSGVIHKKIIEIGEWNMDSSSNKSIAHGLTSSKIRSVNVIIRNDQESTVYYPIFFEAGGEFIINATNILIQREDGSIFNSEFFDGVGFNRGWITIGYID